MNVLILSGENHRFADSAEVINGFLRGRDDLSVALETDKDVLTSGALNAFDVLVHGTGFTRTERGADGSVNRVPDLTPEQENGIFEFVAGGKGLVGIHGTAWWIGGKAVDLIGGHANWHPPGMTFTVQIADDAHPITQGIDDFEVEDEIYMSAWGSDYPHLGNRDLERQATPHGLGQALRRRAGILYDARTWPRHIRAGRYAEVGDAGRAMGRGKLKRTL